MCNLRRILFFLGVVVPFFFFHNQTFAAEARNLYVINSDAVKIKALAKANRYLVTLKHVKPEMLYFADRPQRSATYMDSNQFLKNWHSYFGHTPPNAGLVHVGLAAHEADLTLAMAMELYQPKRVGRDSWQFKATLLKGDNIKTGEFGSSALFIDWSWGGGNPGGGT